MTYRIAPSILSADFARLGEEVAAVVAAGADWIHIDVMDNHFVPNLTIGPMICEALRAYGITQTLDVHLMVEPLGHLIDAFAKAGADYISFHPEATRHVGPRIEQIKRLGCKAGLVLNPNTPTRWLNEVLPELDLVLCMSVNPGFGGQAFMESSLENVREVRRKIDSLDQKIPLAIDGGIRDTNIRQAAEAGADTFVAGSAIFNTPNYAEAIAALRNCLPPSQ